MATGSVDRSRSWKHPAQFRTGTLKLVPKPAPFEDVIDLEFSDMGRSNRMPAGWFVLPSAGFGFLLLLTFLHSI
jgi:hypothetical protein